MSYVTITVSALTITRQTATAVPVQKYCCDIWWTEQIYGSSSEPVRLTSDFESEVISLARYMESVARLQKMQRGLPELLYVLSGFPAR